MRLLLLALFLCACGTAPEPSPKALIVIVDGLRPEYVTPEIMPRLSVFRDRGFAGQAHHAVFPTVTRVNSSSISTGSYPKTHGLTGNSIFVPTAANRVLSTGDKADLDILETAMDGELLTAPTLGELLAGHGKKVFAASSGSSGSGYLMNHRLGLGGLVHYEYVLPDTLQLAVKQRIGLPPAEPSQPNLPRVQYAIDAFLEVGLDYLNADAFLLWITEPDGTAHAHGVGAPQTIEALNGVDEQIGRMLDELDKRNLLNAFTIFFTSDHGFSTNTGDKSINDLLFAEGIKASPLSKEVILAGGAIHIMENKEVLFPQIVRLLQDTPWVGPVFTQEGRAGTLPFSAVYWNHERSADILTAYNWTEGINEHGYVGETMNPGVAGHGSASPYDIRTFFAIDGPAIKKATTSTVPSSNVDLAPTVMHLLGLPVSHTMDGRILTEALTSTPPPDSIEVTIDTLTAETEGYTLMLDRSIVHGYEYVSGTRVQRQ